MRNEKLGGAATAHIYRELSPDELLMVGGGDGEGDGSDSADGVGDNTGCPLGMGEPSNGDFAAGGGSGAAGDAAWSNPDLQGAGA